MGTVFVVQEALRVGQAETGESVLLAPRHVHQYAWKSATATRQLQVTLNFLNQCCISFDLSLNRDEGNQCTQLKSRVCPT